MKLKNKKIKETAALAIHCLDVQRKQRANNSNKHNSLANKLKCLFVIQLHFVFLLNYFTSTKFKLTQRKRENTRKS